MQRFLNYSRWNLMPLNNFYVGFFALEFKVFINLNHVFINLALMIITLH